VSIAWTMPGAVETGGSAAVDTAAGVIVSAGTGGSAIADAGPAGVPAAGGRFVLSSPCQNR